MPDGRHDWTGGHPISFYYCFFVLLTFVFRIKCDFTIHDHFKLVQIESHFTLRDLKGSKLSGNVFNILFNLNKFMAFETRDPFLIRQVTPLFLVTN